MKYIFLFLIVSISFVSAQEYPQYPGIPKPDTSIVNFNEEFNIVSKEEMRLLELLQIPVITGFDSVLTALMPTEISINFVGDIMCHSTQYNYSRVDADSFNFKPVYREIKNFLASSDITIGNLETVFAGKEKGYLGYPLFNTPDDFLDGLAYAGFDILVTANNHSLDRGESGAKRTIRKIKEYGMDYNGSFLSEKDRDSIRIINVKGINIALLSFSYGSNHYQENKINLNVIEDIELENQLKKAKEFKPDFILVYFHFGTEYQKTPSAYQKEIVEKTIKLGADAIVASHPHVLQPIDTYKANNANVDSGFVAYSLGNFISNQRWRYSDGSIILNFKIQKDNASRKIKISEINYLPIWVFKGETQNGKEYIIYPSELAEGNKLPSFLTGSDKKLMKECYNDTKEIINKFSKIPKLIKINGDADFDSTFVMKNR